MELFAQMLYGLSGALPHLAITIRLQEALKMWDGGDISHLAQADCCELTQERLLVVQ